MKFIFAFPISLCLLLSTELLASTFSQMNSVCDRFTAGEIDAHMTLEALELNIYEYSIGVNNTARILCS